jgi:hypothetical protein
LTTDSSIGQTVRSPYSFCKARRFPGGPCVLAQGWDGNQSVDGEVVSGVKGVIGDW